MPQYGYNHSRVFAALKGVTEQLKDNLTTSQYLQALDKYLSNATTPVVVGTRFFDTFLTSIVGWQEKNFRRKVTFESRRMVPGKVINFLLQPTAEERVAAFADIKLDRGLQLQALGAFFKRLELYIAASECRLLRKGESEVDLAYCLFVKKRTEEDLRCSISLSTILSESKFWHDRAYAFKEVIMEKYIRLCLNKAQSDYVHYFKHSIDLNDLIPWYLMAASRAIDKCDSSQGALTSHIESWFKTARTRAAAQRDRIAADIDVEVIDFESEGFRSSLTTGTSSDEADREEKLHEIRYLAKIADPIGAARVYLGIEELLPEDAFKTGVPNERH